MSKVRFGDIVTDVKNKVDRNNNPYEFYVAGDHMDTEDLKIHRKGKFATDDVGPAFIREFKEGQVLYGSRRTYLKKVAVADFDGVTANTTFVFETSDNKKFLQELLPFVILSEGFTQWSIMKSKGSTNPYVLFSDLADYEFELPDIEKQRELAKVLWAMDATKRSYHHLLQKTDELVKSQFIEMFDQGNWQTIKFSDAYTLQMGKTPSRAQMKYWSANDYRWISIADLSSYGKYTGDTKEYISQTAVDETGIKVTPKGTVIMSFKLTIGIAAITSEDIYTNEAIMAFIPRQSDISTDFLRYYLSVKDWSDEGKQAVKGTTLNKNSIGNATIIVPPAELQEQFVIFANQSDKSKFELEQTLSELNATYKRIIEENLG